MHIREWKSVTKLHLCIFKWNNHLLKGTMNRKWKKEKKSGLSNSTYYGTPTKEGVRRLCSYSRSLLSRWTPATDFFLTSFLASVTITWILEEDCHKTDWCLQEYNMPPVEKNQRPKQCVGFLFNYQDSRIRGRRSQSTTNNGGNSLSFRSCHNSTRQRQSSLILMVIIRSSPDFMYYLQYKLELKLFRCTLIKFEYTCKFLITYVSET